MNLTRNVDRVIKLVISFTLILCLSFIIEKSYSNDEKAIEFKFNDLNDKPVRLSDFRGKIVLVDVWATWCGPCRIEIPGFIKLYNKYKNKGLQIIGISVDQGGKKVVENFVKQYKINYTIVMGNQREVLRVFGPIRGIPTTFLIDENGVIKNKYVGVRPEEVFEKDIKKLLENIKK